jgi:NAD(P)-dependent dehydrogenase (short-subunit alcohol dehydrogenase family)
MAKVLITGTSKGIGYEAALLLARVYPHGRRLHAFFNNPSKPEAAPHLVAEMIRHVIETNDPRLRFPVGPDALPFLGWRASLSDEDWIGLGGLQRDADYFERVFLDTGVDLRST